jgi:hypothetical protein
MRQKPANSSAMEVQADESLAMTLRAWILFASLKTFV